jgi:hypothetical protein
LVEQVGQFRGWSLVEHQISSREVLVVIVALPGPPGPSIGVSRQKPRRVTSSNSLA